MGPELDSLLERPSTTAEYNGVAASTCKALLRAQSDSRLAELASSGHEAAFEAIVERYRKPLHRYCRRLLSDSAAEDAVQQAFLSAWSAMQAGTEVRYVRSWLYKIAHNAMLRVVASDGDAHAELAEWMPGRDSAAADVEQQQQVRETFASIADLPARQRKALVETAIHGRPRAELAHLLGLPEGAVRQLVHRARATLREAATAITPLPLLYRLMEQRDRATELAGAGSVGLTGVALKLGAVVCMTGALAAAPTVTERLAHSPNRSKEAAAASATTHAGSTVAAADRKIAARPSATPVGKQEANLVPASANAGSEPSRSHAGASEGSGTADLSTLPVHVQRESPGQSIGAGASPEGAHVDLPGVSVQVEPVTKDAPLPSLQVGVDVPATVGQLEDQVPDLPAGANGLLPGR
jgi:RNA polymerase sigma factor (sigma-70 family)